MFQRDPMFLNSPICFIQTLICFNGTKYCINSFEDCCIQTIYCFYNENFDTMNYVLPQVNIGSVKINR